MKKHESSAEPTVILNKSNSDGFLDFNNSSDMKTVITLLKYIKNKKDKE